MNTHHDDASLYQGRRRLTIEHVPGLVEDDGPPPFGSARVEPRPLEPTFVMPDLDGSDEKDSDDHEDAHAELLTLRNAQIEYLVRAYRCELRAHFELNESIKKAFETEAAAHAATAETIGKDAQAAEARLVAMGGAES